MTKIKRVGAGLAALALVSAGTAACSYGEDDGAQASGQKLTEKAFNQQQKAVPYPVNELKDSLERRNLKEKLLRTNDPSKVGYVYIMNYGKFVGYYVVKGKVSSTQSQMTTDTLVTWQCRTNHGCTPVPVTAPGDDGSYGENETGIFFFTTSGAYITTNLDYVYSDQPMQIDVPNLLKQ